VSRAILIGTPGSPGVGIGRLLWLAPAADAAATAPGRGEAGDPADERTKLMAALATAASELSALAEQTASRASEEIGAIFAAQALFATDPGIVEPALAAIDGGASAAEAIDRATAEQADKLAGVDDDYFRDRAADVLDVGRRVVDLLLARARPDLHHRDGSPAVVASEDLDPSVVAILRRELVAGLALAGGAPNGHAAIVARALGIPLVLGLGPTLDASLDGASVAVNGTAGRLLVEPDEAELDGLAAGPAHERVTRRPSAPLPVRLEANVGSVREAAAAAAAGAEGIGLVRTELLFLGRSSPPGLGEQRALYRRIAATMPGQPVVFRTLDIGGDKPASYLEADVEMNPALGVRGIRLALSRPELMETQLRALLEADPASPLRLLVPMVATVEEVAAVRRAIASATITSRRDGAEVADDVRLGIMVEIPSAAILADAFAPMVDFFSIGTNDLVQYTLAADRTSPALAELATPLQPAILRLIKSVTDAALAFERPVAVCGEAAADPGTAAILIGLGVGELSVAPTRIGPLRHAIASLDADACRSAAAQALLARSVGEVRRIAAGLLRPDDSSAGSPAA
jgi:multiphosphoryl transfer protein